MEHNVTVGDEIKPQLRGYLIPKSISNGPIQYSTPLGKLDTSSALMNLRVEGCLKYTSRPSDSALTARFLSLVTIYHLSLKLSQLQHMKAKPTMTANEIIENIARPISESAWLRM